MGFLCTLSWDKVGQSGTERRGVSVHSELGQGGTKWDKEVGSLCTVSWDKVGQRNGMYVHSESYVSWDKVGKSETKKWDLRAQ